MTDYRWEKTKDMVVNKIQIKRIVNKINIKDSSAVLVAFMTIL